MSTRPSKSGTSASGPGSLRSLAWLLLPLIGLGLFLVLLFRSDPLALLSDMAPPLEELTVEQTLLDDNGITLWVRADGSEPMHIAQIQVDGAFWQFSQTPAGPIDRLDLVRLDLPYPWVAGEPHFITLITNSGTTFDHEIAVALPSPKASAEQFIGLAVIGIFIGLVPVALGMLSYPALRRSGSGSLQFLLALTVGLLVFLLIDTLGEALELADEAAGAFKSPTLVWAAAIGTFLLLLVIGRRKGEAPTGTGLAGYLSLGIGLHNLGEGLAVGAAFAVGETALGTFLLVGFVLHNITEGIGIVAPLVNKRPATWVFVALALLAGLPAVFGVWVGAFAFAPQWASLFFAIGAGAILQVVFEVSAYLSRRSAEAGGSWLSLTSLSGFLVGLAVMYGTALLVTA
ncbi:ZIP family metal transporter [Kiloniella laminariae]|uniref:ZIP family metal transporter n=1 Tax=Kiloniella laminariae TaxID=454162 RepID=A0ABT4LF26_9PROT|nr:ZIP family metal transporter [Kiloniella laminariae]MCZ4279704.1 ZIP family metal transporter [Kiloniella laminariae]